MKKMKLTAIILSLLLVLTTFTPLSTYAWESSGAAVTSHAFLVEQALTILENDLGTAISNDSSFKTIKNNLAKLKEGSIAPDNLSNVALGGLTEGDFWSSHFYDPDTEKNYSTTSPKIHAEFQTQRFIKMAVAEWKSGNYQQAVYLLGYASHFYSDLCNPHHAANNTVLDAPYNHGTFETYVQARHSSFTVSSLATRTTAASQFYYNTVNNYNSFPEYIYKSAKSYAKEAKNAFSQYCQTDSSSNWDQAAAITFTNSQKGLALLYYRFIQELKLVKKLTVTVGTSEDWWSGTDNDIYFGFRTDTGASYEYLLDKKNDIMDGAYGVNTYNDFEMGDVESYDIYVYNKTLDLKRVTSVWLKKVTGTISDDWKCATVDLAVDGKVVNSVAPNVWLTSSKATFSWAVPGLVPTNESPIGTFSVRIKTSSDWYSGTDNNVYFGMQMYDGRKVEYLCDKSGYNDFEMGDDDTYSFTINDPTFRAYQVDKIWLRKEKGTIDDGWKPTYVEVTMGGVKVYTANINKWLEDNYQQHTMAVSGLDYQPYVLKDTGFEAQNTSGIALPWSFEGTASRGISSGTGSAHTDSNNAWIRTSGNTWSAIKQTVSVTPNTNYVLTGWVRSTSNVANGYFGVRNMNGTVLKEVKYGSLPQYTKLTVSFNSGSNTSVTVFGGFWGAGSDSWIMLDSINFMKALQ